VEEQVLPDRLDIDRIAAEQTRRKVIVQQRQHGGPSGADGVRITGTGEAGVIEHRDEQRLLRALNAWIASVRTTFGSRSTWRNSTRVILRTCSFVPFFVRSGCRATASQRPRRTRRACCLAAAKLALKLV